MGAPAPCAPARRAVAAAGELAVRDSSPGGSSLCAWGPLPHARGMSRARAAGVRRCWRGGPRQRAHNCPVIIDGYAHQLPDIDPTETAEWLDSLDSVIEGRGRTRARDLLARPLARAP